MNLKYSYHKEKCLSPEHFARRNKKKEKKKKNYVSFLHTKMIKILPEAHPKVREGILHMILSLQVTPIQSLNQEGTWFLLPSQP